MVYLKLFLKYLPWILGLALLVFLGSRLYSHVYDKGATSVQVQWDAEKQKQLEATNKLKADYEKKERDNRTENRRISDELAQAKLDHANALADLRTDFAQRLRTSEMRSTIYQRQAEGGAAQCRDLASHASRLDASLEEGRSLVRELRETLGLRDRQVHALGNQINSDRALFQDASNGR